MARYTLGTYDDRIRYSAPATLDQITGNLSTRCDTYDFDTVLRALHPDAKNLLVGSAQISAKESILGKA